MDISGACLCGDITWDGCHRPRAGGRLPLHRLPDRRRHGISSSLPASRATIFACSAVQLTAYIKVAESGNPRAMSFCGRCATMIHTGNTDDTGLLSLRLGGCHQKHEAHAPDSRSGVSRPCNGLSLKGVSKCPIRVTASAPANPVRRPLRSRRILRYATSRR